MVRAGLAQWHEGMVAEGFVVVSPVAPKTGLFTGASHRRLPALLDHVAERYAVESGRWHLFGISNGGRSALVVGSAYPNRFRSVTVLPGALARPASLDVLGSTPVTFVVGSEDGGWVQSSRAAHRSLSQRGGNSRLVVLEGQGHAAFQTVAWEQLRAWLTRA